MNIVICEDRLQNIQAFSSIIRSFFQDKNIEFSIKAFNSYEDTIDYIKSLNSYDDCLYILDIDLKQDKNGLLLGREIRTIDDYKGEMIYITAHVHQINSVFKYKLRILDFIDKGFNLGNDLREALKVYLKIYKDRFENKSLTFKSGGEVFLVKTSDIVWIETEKQKKKIIIHTIKEQITVNLTLKEIQEKLTNQFIQIHRCAIVNRVHIKKIECINEDLYVVLTGDIKELISKRKEKEVRSCLAQL